jgi:DNA-binding transcriptional MerR regulator
MTEKSASAYRTIGELSQEIGVRQHILRYWETRFPQLRPLQRAGGRRYYRPEDVALVRRIHSLLTHDGYTIRGVQTLLNNDRRSRSATPVAAAGSNESNGNAAPVIDLSALQHLRRLLADALAADARAT